MIEATRLAGFENGEPKFFGDPPLQDDAPNYLDNLPDWLSAAFASGEITVRAVAARRSTVYSLVAGDDVIYALGWVVKDDAGQISLLPPYAYTPPSGDEDVYTPLLGDEDE